MEAVVLAAVLAVILLEAKVDRLAALMVLTESATMSSQVVQVSIQRRMNLVILLFLFMAVEEAAVRIIQQEAAVLVALAVEEMVALITRLAQTEQRTPVEVEAVAVLQATALEEPEEAGL